MRPQLPYQRRPRIGLLTRAASGLRLSIAVETGVGLAAVLAASLLVDLPPALHR